MSDTLQTIHLPTGMGSTTLLEDLPDDILMEVFTYLSVEDLIHSVQHVSTRWQCVVQEAYLWRKLQYKPTDLENDEDINHILQQTPELRTLVLDKSVSSSVLSSMQQNCTELRKLTFSISQKLTKQSARSLFLNCPKLEYLTVPARTVRSLEETIGQLQKLKTLNILGRVSYPCSVFLRSIGDGCPMLQHLDIRHLIFTNEDLKYFIRLKQHQLQSITVRCLTIDEKCTIPYFTVCKTLNKMNIHELCNVCSAAGFDALRCMKNITALTLGGIDSFDVDILVSLFNNKGMCHLIELKLELCEEYEDQLCETICNNCPLLKDLGFIHCFNLTDRSLEYLLKLQELEYLNLRGCKEITDRGMDFVFKCKRLKYLNVCYCAQLTEQCMMQLSDLNILETLILDHCNIKGLPLNLIPTLLPKLKLLSINYCRGVNWEDLHQLHAEMPHLNVSEKFFFK